MMPASQVVDLEVELRQTFCCLWKRQMDKIRAVWRRPEEAHGSRHTNLYLERRWKGGTSRTGFRETCCVQPADKV